MKPFKTPESTTDAIALQHTLCQQVQLTYDAGDIRLVAGVDVGYDMHRNLARAALVTMTIDTLEPITSVVAYAPVTFPYVPGLLSFREAPVILKALEQLPTMPDLLMVDGHGIAHPRRLGIAAHIGVLTGLPTIGVAKSRLCGTYREPGINKGEQSPLYDKQELIGTVLRSRDKVKPLFISPGHRMDQTHAVKWVMRCLTRYRLPEPTRLADKLSKTSAT